MFSKEQLDLLLKRTMEQLGIEEDNDKNDENIKKDSKKKKSPKIDLSPAQIIVVAALLSGVLEVDTFSVDKDQVVSILLTGSLKRKTELEKTMDQVGTKPFDEVMKALLGRY